MSKIINVELTDEEFLLLENFRISHNRHDNIEDELKLYLSRALINARDFAKKKIADSLTDSDLINSINK